MSRASLFASEVAALPATLAALRARVPGLSIATRTLHFVDPWVGHRGLNRAGLHVARITVSDALAALRRLEARTSSEPIVRTLRRDGIAVVEGFLPPSRFEALRREVHQRVDALEANVPMQSRGERGFGEPHAFDGGFDRWDGGTLNRFGRIDASMPETARTARELARLGAALPGARPTAAKVLIYQTVHGDEAENPDVQKELHRDTFQIAVKLWYFLDDVTPDDGPFEYVPGSHRMDATRLRWEHRRALAALDGDRSGSFRASEADLRELGLGAPRAYPARANTLVVADVRGFHRRGAATLGARRLSLYGNFRPEPFVPFPT